MEGDSKVVRQADWHNNCQLSSESANSSKEKLKFYNDFADVYDGDMIYYKYRGPIESAMSVHKYLKGNVDARILDVGCGTGLVMRELRRYAYYCNADGLDASVGMTRVAQEKDYYQKIYNQDFNVGSGLQHAAYDLVLCSSCFVPGHIKAEAVKELYLLAKPGGYILVTLKSSYLEDDDDLRQLRPIIENMCRDGKCELVEEVEFEGIVEGSPGTKFILKRLN